MLARDREIFPNFRFNPALHNPEGRDLSEVEDGTFEPFHEGAGALPADFGLAAWVDGARQADPGDPYLSRGEARDRCLEIQADYPQAVVTCAFAGQKF